MRRKTLIPSNGTETMHQYDFWKFSDGRKTLIPSNGTETLAIQLD